MGMKGYFIDEYSYDALLKLAKVQALVANDYNFLDIIESLKPIEV